MEKYTINIVIGGADPLTQMYTDTDSPRTLSPTISLTNDSKESCFKGNTRHELEHVKTNWQLIRKVGTDTFLSLFKEDTFPASIAFVGCAEFLSWKAACEYNPYERRTGGIPTVSGYIENHSEEIRQYRVLIDAIAAYQAYYLVRGEEPTVFNGYENYKEAGNLIELYSRRWPLSLQEFNELGNALLKLIKM